MSTQTLNLIPGLSSDSLKNLTGLSALISEHSASSTLWVMPPLVDLCARLREPGFQQHGTLATEGRAAVKNGFLHVLTPPDTHPILQSGPLLEGLRQKAWQDAGIHLHILGAMTEDLKGATPANIAGLKQGGAVGVTNARRSFVSDQALLGVLEYAKTLDVKVFFYPDEPSLSSGGCAHDGYVASRHGLRGIPWIAETTALAKQLLMIQEVGVSAHFSQLSCKGSVDLIRLAKFKGLPVTCDVAMHQLFLTDDLLTGFNTMAHVLPPLRGHSDQKALREGLKDGTIDAICSHHEPLSASSKNAPFADTLPGMSPFDTFMPLACQLVGEGVLSASELIDKISTAPAQIAGIELGDDDWLLVDPEHSAKLTAEQMHSQGKNSAFLGEQMTGKVLISSFDRN